MVKTTINISERTYKALVEMAIEKYGHARAISKVIEDLLNEKKRKYDPDNIIKKAKKIKIDINLKAEEIDKIIEEQITEEIK